MRVNDHRCTVLHDMELERFCKVTMVCGTAELFHHVLTHVGSFWGYEAANIKHDKSLKETMKLYSIGISCHALQFFCGLCVTSCHSQPDKRCKFNRCTTPVL
jgi:hypothetical protein